MRGRGRGYEGVANVEVEGGGMGEEGGGGDVRWAVVRGEFAEEAAVEGAELALGWECCGCHCCGLCDDFICKLWM